MKGVTIVSIKSILSNISFSLLPLSTNKNSKTEIPDGTYQVKSSNELMNHPDIINLIERIKGFVCLPDSTFNKYYMTLLNRYAQFVQFLPASRAHHHAYAMGLLIHTLEVVEIALRLKERYAIPPGVAPENAGQTRQQWIFGIVAAAVLHDIGKVATDLLITLYDDDYKKIGRWSPYMGPMTGVTDARYYSIKFNPKPDYSYHTLLSSALMMDIVPRPLIDWISRERELFYAVLSVIQGDYQSGGVIGEIVRKADGLSTSRALGGQTAARVDKTALSLGDKIRQTIRYLLTETSKVPLNRPGAAGFVYQGFLYATAKRFTDELRDEMVRNGHTSVPGDNIKMFAIFQENNLVEVGADGKSVLSVKINLEDANGIKTWDRELTVLKFNLEQFIPNIDEMPEPMSGNVELIGKSAPSLETKEEQIISEVSDAKNGLNLQHDGVTNPSSEKSQLAEVKTDDVNTSPDINNGLEDKNLSVSEQSEVNANQTSFFALANSVEDDPEAKLVTNNPVQHRDNSPSHNVTTVENSESLNNKKEIKDEAQSTKSDKQELANEFITWLKNAIESNNVVYNSSNALVHVVLVDNEKRVLLMSPKVFQVFMQKKSCSDPDITWKNYQKAFLSQGYHIRNAATGGANFFSFGVKAKRGEDKSIKGVLVRDYRLFFDNEPPKNDMLYPV